MARIDVPVKVAMNFKDGMSANETKLSPQACDATEKQKMLFTGRELIIARNTGASSRNFTITSRADRLNRTGDLTIAIPAGELHVFEIDELEGFRQDDGYIYFEAAHAEVVVAGYRPRSH